MFNAIEDAIQAFSCGEFVIVVDDPDRENEGDLIIAAQDVNEEKMAFMIRHTSGVICAPVLPSRCDQLDLPLMVPLKDHTESHGTSYTISIDAKAKTTTGISAYDRALTCNLMADSSISSKDFVRPGHMFPLKSRQGGVLVRRGHTEAAVDLCRLSGKYPVGVISELIMDNGKMMLRDDLVAFAKLHKLKIITIDDLCTHIRDKCARESIDWNNIS